MTDNGRGTSKVVRARPPDVVRGYDEWRDSEYGPRAGPYDSDDLFSAWSAGVRWREERTRRRHVE